MSGRSKGEILTTGMKIVVTGTRGIPGIPGGVETHCEELFPRIAAMGHDITVIRRSCYVTPENRISHYKGVNLKDIYAPRLKSIEAALHTFLAVLAARRMKPDILHIHAIGPSLMVPLARLLGMKVVVTHHGPDYDRGKWGRLAKMALMTGEKMGAKFANEVIVISEVIASLLANKYGRTDTHLIFNGVPTPSRATSTDYLHSLGISPYHYLLAVGRFVPEKNFHQLVQAFADSGLADSGYRLVIAGDADHPDHYSTSLKRQATESGAILTGFIKGEPLYQLFSHAALFVLPSSHEGLPISLLEAMSYGRDLLVSDIPANKLPQLSSSDFFPTGDVKALTSALRRKLSSPTLSRSYDMAPYNWDTIAHQTVALYSSLL